MIANFKPWLLLGIIFVVGAVTGSALTIGLGSHFMRAPVPRDMQRHWMAHLTRDLGLTEDQQAKIQPIIADADAKLQALRRDEVERGSQIFKATDDQIAALLRPDQKVELLKMQSDREKMFSGHGHLWGVPHEGLGGAPPPPPAPADAATNAAPAP